MHNQTDDNDRFGSNVNNDDACSVRANSGKKKKQHGNTQSSEYLPVRNNQLMG